MIPTGHLARRKKAIVVNGKSVSPSVQSLGFLKWLCEKCNISCVVSFSVMARTDWLAT